MAMTLPPYGEMAHEYAIRLQWDPMRDWRRGEPLIDRRATFEIWREKLMVKIADTVFPRYKDRDGNIIAAGWAGSATAFAEAMTVAELNFMIEQFQRKPSISCPMLHRDPDSPGMPYTGRRSHFQHFSDEDDLHKEVAINYIDYDRELSASDNAELKAVADLAYATKIRGLHYLKDRSQRPQALSGCHFFQGAWILSVPCIHQHDSIHSCGALHRGADARMRDPGALDRKMGKGG